MNHTPGILSASPTKKKNRSKEVKFTEEIRNELKRMKNQFSDFFLVMVDFILTSLKN